MKESLQLKAIYPKLSWYSVCLYQSVVSSVVPILWTTHPIRLARLQFFEMIAHMRLPWDRVLSGFSTSLEKDGTKQGQERVWWTLQEVLAGTLSLLYTHRRHLLDIRSARRVRR